MVLAMVTVCACSEQEDLSQLANRLELNDTRTVEWKTKTVTLETIGTLEAKLAEAMEGEELSALEKLVVSGPMSGVDFTYLRNNLLGLKALDMKDVAITASDEWYQNPYGWSQLKNDTIGNSMFRGFNSLREIILPSNTLYIGDYAFYSCDSLESVIMPDGVKTIRYDAFRDCNSLASIVLPAHLEAIEERVFYSCDSLKSINIPDKVKYIGHEAFENSNQLSSVEFTSSSELDSIANWAFYNCNLKSLVLPDKVRTIGSYAFNSNDSLVSVQLPDNLEKLENCAFQSCHSLKSLVIPAKVKYIGNHAFNNCRKLSFLEFAENAVLDSIANNAFNETNLKSLMIPDKVKYIGEWAFNDCDSLKSLTLSSELQGIENSAFRRCISLESVVIPDKVKYLGYDSFIDCYALTTVEFSSLSQLDSIAQGVFAHTNIESIMLPAGVKHIGLYAFYNCQNLDQLHIHENVAFVHENFISNCNNLRTVFWNAPIDVPNCYINDYCLLYVDTDAEITVDECWTNVILNGVAQSTINIQVNDGQKFNIPQEFTAPEVIYTRHFGEETHPGGSSGWQTIVLPFTPDSIYHESKGRVAPFNSVLADGEAYKPFWLRELTSDGFVDVTSMTPDKAYIIAMPNSSAYYDEYCLGGTITFTAKNVTLAKTPETLEPSVGPTFELHPTYEFVKKALYIYALTSKWGDYNHEWYNRSFFTRSGADIQPFNAYVTAPGGVRSSKSEFDLDTRSSSTRGVPYQPNKSGIPQIGDM